jgi:hypothetical protein
LRRRPGVVKRSSCRYDLFIGKIRKGRRREGEKEEEEKEEEKEIVDH